MLTFTQPSPSSVYFPKIPAWLENLYLKPMHTIYGMVGRAFLRGLFYTIFSSSILMPLLFSSLIPQSSRPTASATPSSYSWSSLRVDSVSIAYSVDERAWYGGTGYLHIKANGLGVYSDTKTATAVVTIPEGLSASVYVCGDDRFPPPDGWTVLEKYLRLYVDGAKVYELGKEYWWAKCYRRAATIGQGTHEVRLTVGVTINVSSNAYLECDLAYASMDIRLEGSGTIMAESHAAEAALDGETNHVFTFRLPRVSGVGNMSWRAVWRGVEKTGYGTPGSVQKAVFQDVNRDCWSFTSPVVIRIGGSVPSASVGEGYAIDAVYYEGSGEVGVHKVAVAISDGDEVGFTSGKYLVTEIKRDTKVVGGTLIGSEIWANSGSTISFNQTISYYSSSGWVTEKIRGGVETGSAVVKVFQELNVSRRIGFSSKNRSDELELTVRIPRITLVFTHIVVSAERNGGSVNVRVSWAHDGSPVAGLRVKCFETDQSGVTDLNGRVSFSISGSGFEAIIYPVEGRNGITTFEKARVGL